MCKHFVCTHINSCFLFPYILDCFYVLNHFEQVKKKKKNKHAFYLDYVSGQNFGASRGI